MELAFAKAVMQRLDVTSWYELLRSICGRSLGAHSFKCRTTPITITLFFNLKSSTRIEVIQESIHRQEHISHLQQPQTHIKAYSHDWRALTFDARLSVLGSADGCFGKCEPRRSVVVGGRCGPCQCQGHIAARGGKVPCELGESWL